MATSSSNSSAVDLGEAADLDDATSKLFFSDVSAAGPGLSWPAASEIHSTLTSRDSLVAECSKHGVPSELTPVCAHHLGWRACTPPPMGSNKMCVYAAALDAGLRFPLHGFYVRLLQHYRLAPSQLAPNAWSYLAAFVLLCQDAGVEPLVSAWRYFFTICAHRHKSEPTGWHHFQPYHDGSRRLFTGSLPSRSGWKSRFFFLECPSGWKCPVKWGKPTRQDARPVQLTDVVIEKLKKMGCFDIKVFLANREMPVGDPALKALQELKAEAGAGAAGAGAAAVGVAAENASMRKRCRLSPAGHVSSALALAPIRASSTGGLNGHIPPPVVSDAFQLWEAMAKASEQEDMIAKLNQELRAGRAKNAELTAHLRAANDRNSHLNEDLVRLDKMYVAERKQLIGHLHTSRADVARLKAATVEVAQLKAEHAAECAQLKKELEAEAEQLREELAEDAGQLKHQGYTMGASDMRDLALTMYMGVISPDELKVELLLDTQGASPVAGEDLSQLPRSGYAVELDYDSVGYY